MHTQTQANNGNGNNINRQSKYVATKEQTGQKRTSKNTINDEHEPKQ